MPEGGVLLDSASLQHRLIMRNRLFITLTHFCLRLIITLVVEVALVAEGTIVGKGEDCQFRPQLH